jgi:N-acetylglucosaminyldiphosphoundecaprenol N-acetyl-beta-D-mannosaminyltransferase
MVLALDVGDDPIDDLSRPVYCVLGIPVDAVDMATLRRRVAAASRQRRRFLISTVNLNFLINSQSDAEFRESLVLSDLCTCDGISVLWIGRLLGAPIAERIAGADFLEAFRSGGERSPLAVYLFGGTEGVAAAAARSINRRSPQVRCVGWHFPGYGSASQMSEPDILAEINASGADVLLASLGAAKGQSWLLANHDRLRVPVRAHVGAALNFEAGLFRRAPPALQKYGLEWLWRIKEEPYLWRRYWSDGSLLLALLLKRALPLLFARLWLRSVVEPRPAAVTVEESDRAVRVRIEGPATIAQMPELIAIARQALATKPATIGIDVSQTTDVDARFLGFILVLRKIAMRQGAELAFEGLSPTLARVLRLSGVLAPSRWRGPAEEAVTVQPGLV